MSGKIQRYCDILISVYRKLKNKLLQVWDGISKNYKEKRDSSFPATISLPSTHSVTLSSASKQNYCSSFHSEVKVAVHG